MGLLPSGWKLLRPFLSEQTNAKVSAGVGVRWVSYGRSLPRSPSYLALSDDPICLQYRHPTLRAIASRPLVMPWYDPQ